MGPDSRVKADHCPCCRVCTNCPGFQKVLDVPEAGYVLYRHTTRVDDINKKTGALETTINTVDDVFIIENTQGEDLGKIDITPEIDRNNIKCPRCVHILKHAQTLIKNQDIGKSDVMGICQHCRKFGRTCVKCEDAVEKFQTSKRAKKDSHSQRVKTWLSKIQKIIKLSLFNDKKGKQMTRGYSDVDLNNLLRKIKAGREPDIEDLFLQGVRELYASKRGPRSEIPYFSRAKDKDIAFEEPKPDDAKQKEYIQMRKAFFKDDSLMPSLVTLTEDELEKDFVRKFGKSYKDNLRYSTPAESKWFEQDDYIPVPGMRQEREKKKYELKYYIGTPHSEEKSKVSSRYVDKTGELSSDNGYEHEKTKKDAKYIAVGEPHVSDSRRVKEDYDDVKPKKYIPADEKIYEDNRKKYGEEYATAADQLPDKWPLAKDSGKRLERKVSPTTKVIYESPSRIRKYRSDESLLTGMTKMTEDVQKHDTFDYYFPETIGLRKRLKVEREVSSSELIKDTLVKLRSKIEEEKRKREEAERIKEERRKRLERERKEREERLIAQQMAKAIEKMPKEKEKVVDDAIKDKVPKETKIKDKPAPTNKLEKPEKKVKEPKVKEEKIKEEKPKSDKVKEEKVKPEKVKEDKPKQEKIAEDKTKQEKVKEEKPKVEKSKEEMFKDKKPKDREQKGTPEKDNQKHEASEKENRIRLQQAQVDKEMQMQELKMQREEAKKAKAEEQAKAKAEAEKKKKLMEAEMPQQMFELTKIKMKKPSIHDLIQEHTVKTRGPPKEIKIPTMLEFQTHMGKHGKKESSCDMCLDSDYDLDVQNVLWKRDDDKVKKDTIKEAVLGENIFRYKRKFGEEEAKDPNPPSLFQRNYEESYEPAETVKPDTCGLLKTKSAKSPLKPDAENGKGIVSYSLSDRTFIDKGWTKLPTEKVVRKMNVYRMRPAHPEFDWFEHNKKKGFLQYDTGEKLAEIDENGRGRWYYRSGLLALDYYNAEEMNAQQRFVVYSSGEPDQRGRTHPRTVLASFDYLGNGIVFDHTGKIRLKFNQTEGIILDRSLGPVSHWKWHTLNDPPVLQQVMIDTQMSHKDPNILKLGGPGENKPRVDDEAMLAIEFDNFIKEKSAKLTQSFKPFQIKMKALKINEYFSLRVLDQANVYLIYRDGTTNIKLNIGMILDHKEIVDTDTAEVGEVSSNLERLPAKTDSLAELQRNIANAQKIERTRFERDRRVNRPQPVLSVDRLQKAASKPLKVPLMTVDSSSGVSRFCKCRKPSACNVYYGTGFV